MGWTPLYCTCHRGHPEAARLLLKAGASAATCDSDGLNAICTAAKRGYEEVVKVLLDVGRVDPNLIGANKQGVTALHWGAFCGHEKVVKILLDAGADKTIKSKKGKIPFE